MKQQGRTEQTSHLQDNPRAATGSSLAEKGVKAEPAAPETSETETTMNPLNILAAITLGLPGLAMILVVGGNPGIQEGTLATLATLLVLSAFVIAAIFEIKRLADQPSDKSTH